jgi:DNA-directed RNA polymerase specialized sigma24 family protein
MLALLHGQHEIPDPLLFDLQHRFSDKDSDKSSMIASRYATLRTQLSPDQQIEIVQRHADGESLRRLAATYGVSQEAVRQALKRNSKLS